MAGKRRYTEQQVIDALKKHRGYVSQAAQELRCSAETVYAYTRDFPAVLEAWEDLKEQRHDFVENKLMMLIEHENPAAIIFYAKTQMKQRGYVERQEWAGVPEQPIQIKRIVEKRG